MHKTSIIKKISKTTSDAFMIAIVKIPNTRINTHTKHTLDLTQLEKIRRTKTT